MKSFKFNLVSSFLLLTLFTTYTAFTQEKKKDTLANISFDELYLRYNKNIYDTIKSSAYAIKYLELAKINKDKYDLICGYSMMAGRREYQLGIKYLDTMLKIAKTYDKSMVTYTYLRLGQFNTNNRRLKEALRFYLIAYKNIDPKNDLYKNEVKHGIAVVKSIMGRCNEALPYFIETEEKLRNSKDLEPYKSIVYTLSNTYFRLNKMDQAENYTNKGLLLTNENQKYITHQLFVSNRGKIFYKRKKYTQAISDLTNALPFIKKANDYANYAENCFFIGKSYIKLKNKSKALVYFNKIDSIFNKRNYIFPDIITSFNHLIENSRKNKNLEQSLYFTNQLLKADSVININYNYITTTAHKEYDIPELLSGKEKLIEELQNKATNSIILYSITIFIIIGAFGWYVSKRKKEIAKQKILFDEYIFKNNNKLVDNKTINNVKGNNTVEIEDYLIAGLLHKLERFEKEKGFLKETTLDSLAKEFETNTTYLSQVINKKKGVNFSLYINNLRIEHTINLLQSDKKHLKYSIKGLAYEAGFSSVQSFSRAFVAKTGVNASFFIKNLKNNNIN